MNSRRKRSSGHANFVPTKLTMEKYPHISTQISATAKKAILQSPSEERQASPLLSNCQARVHPGHSKGLDDYIVMIAGATSSSCSSPCFLAKRLPFVWSRKQGRFLTPSSAALRGKVFWRKNMDSKEDMETGNSGQEETFLLDPPSSPHTIE